MLGCPVCAAKVSWEVVGGVVVGVVITLSLAVKSIVLRTSTCDPMTQEWPNNLPCLPSIYRGTGVLST